MPSPDVKREWVLKHEQAFARDLAAAVINTPKLSLWTILIPIILVYHVHRHNTAVKGRSAFVQHYLLSRTWALDEAYTALVEQRPPDIEAVTVKADDLPQSARPAYGDWIKFLVQHYGDLLAASGKNFKALIAAVYCNRTNYLLHLHQLNEKEKAVNTALENHVAGNARNVSETITRIETCSADLRCRQAAAFFP